VVHLTTYADARDALRHRDLRQALYDEGRSLMEGVIVNLHGDDHRARRRLENRLFRRDTFAYYEDDVIPATIESALRPSLQHGRADLVPLARRTMMTLSAAIAGVDHSLDGAADFDELYDLMVRLSRASTVVHAVGDRAAVIADGDAALAAFERSFLVPSVARRRELLGRFEQGDLPEDELPRDVLATLLRNQDRLHLPDDVVLREVAYFPWVGSHSTSNAFVLLMDHVFAWIAGRPDRAASLAAQPAALQALVHESLRLHPASPVALRWAQAPVELRSGQVLRQGALAAIELVEANRDPLVFGPDAHDFVPRRPLPDDVAPWGLSFGSGMHACLGQELAAGLAPEPADASGPPGSGTELHGAITAMAGVLLGHGARPDPDQPPVRDADTTRLQFASYPVTFSG
jgi:cytochrome P450